MDSSIIRRDESCPPVIPAESAQAEMVPVIPDDHVLANEFQQLLLELNQDIQPSGAHPWHETMPCLADTVPFQYHALDDGEFRVVILHPGVGDSPLMCSLMTSRLDGSSREEYEALSYAWGDPTRLHQLRCSHTEVLKMEDKLYQVFPMASNASIGISNNLRDALFRLRQEDDFRALWIDALCIDQDNVSERSKQVQQMATIYERAEKVIVWLGEENNRTKDAFHCIKMLLEMKERLQQSFPHPEDPQQVGELGCQPWLLDPSNPGYLPFPTWAAFRDLLGQRSWFVRAWVFQEIVMADDAIVLCGGFSAEWDDLYQACDIADTYKMYNTDRAMHFIGEGESSFTVFHDVVQKGSRRAYRQHALKSMSSEAWLLYRRSVSFETLLIQTRLSDATDPRDKVFSILSLSNGDESMPRVDYSLNVREVYIQVAKYWITRNMEISINLTAFLSSVQMANPLHCLPSWVPDWSCPPIASLLMLEGDFMASGDTKPTMRFVDYAHTTSFMNPSEIRFLDFHIRDAVNFFPTEQKRISMMGDARDSHVSLAAKGVRLLTVQAAERRATMAQRTEHRAKFRGLQDPYPTTNKSYREIYPKVINPVRSEDLRRTTEEGVPNFWQYLGKSRETALASSSPITEPEASSDTDHALEDDDRDLPPYFEAVGSLNGPFGTYSRSFFVTTYGFMGIGPTRTKEGDEVCILLGCKIPLVVRKCEDQDRYFLVGECYVYGLMDGEAMDGLDENMIEELVFN